MQNSNKKQYVTFTIYKIILVNVYGISYNDKELIINQETITASEKKSIHINWLE